MASLSANDSKEAPKNEGIAWNGAGRKEDASLLALKRLQLDGIWWLVTPGNPLKDTSGLAPLDRRIAAAERLTHHPRIHVTGLEAVINSRYTFQTITFLVRRCSGVRFVWIMGAERNEGG